MISCKLQNQHGIIMDEADAVLVQKAEAVARQRNQRIFKKGSAAEQECEIVLVYAQFKTNIRRIPLTAYYLWEKAGRPEGRSDEFWYAAVKMETKCQDLE